jgi:hypothetical protein
MRLKAERDIARREACGFGLGCLDGFVYIFVSGVTGQHLYLSLLPPFPLFPLTPAIPAIPAFGGGIGGNAGVEGNGGIAGIHLL